MDLPFEIFIGFIVLCVSMGIIGLWKKVPMLLFISGSLIAFWAIMTDNIIMGVVPLSSTDAGATTTYVMTDNLYPFTEYPKILFGLMGSIFGLAGALLWKASED